MITKDPRWAIRPDLVQRRVWMGNERVWVVKDPLSRAFSYFSEQEHEILSLADGTRSLQQIAEECRSKLASSYISVESLVRFFADAREKGLLLVHGSSVSSEPPSDTNRRRWWQNPLAIRLPGINPDRFLDRVIPFVRPLFSPLALIVTVTLMLIAAVIVARDLDPFSQHLAIAAGRFASGNALITLLIVLSLTKVMHELAHALACKYFGGECREIGVMLLVGVPCLYCDVSDAWMLPRRWQRILVSAAGMIAELTLASIATLVWAFTVDGPLRDVCVTIMVVCSVTTVMFNGNPLLRYDGYYILSDLIGIPNLAAESSAVIRGWIRRLLWNLPLPRSNGNVSLRNLGLAGYGVASGMYRFAIYAFILRMLYRFSERYEMEGPVGVLALTALVWFVIKWIKSILTPPDRSIRSASMSARRPWSMVAALAAISLLIGMTPLPRSIPVPMTVQPADAQWVYVTNAGTIDVAIANGADVKEGEQIVRLTNFEVERELMERNSECERLAVRLAVLRQQRGTNSGAAAQLPAVEKALNEAIGQRDLRERLASQLTIRAPQTGRLFAASSRLRGDRDDRLPQFWVGTPLDPVNRGAWLDEGTELCVVGDAVAREAVLLVRQQDIDSIRPHQRVSFLLADREKGEVRGRVLEVAMTPVDEIPAELNRNGIVEASLPNLRSKPLYQVRVAIEPTSAPLPVRLTGQARVHVQRLSIFHRVARFLRDAIG